MFSSTLLTLALTLGTALSPEGGADPELRGPRWQGRPSATAQAETSELRDPFARGRGGIAATDGRDAGGTLRDPFGGRTGVASAHTTSAASDADALRRPFGAR